MSMRIQDALSNCCEGIKDFASSAASWIGKTVSAIGSYLAEMAAKVAQFVKPHFEHLKTFAQEHKQLLIVGSIGIAIGAVLTMIINNVFCSSTPASTSSATP